MMMTSNPLRAAALIAAGALSACAATPPTAAQLRDADYGELPARYEASVHQYFDATLKDPSSIQYREVTAPEKGYMQSHSVIAGTKLNYGWLVKATINAKNIYGGYVGFRTYTFLFRGDQIVDTIIPDAE